MGFPYLIMFPPGMQRNANRKGLLRLTQQARSVSKIPLPPPQGEVAERSEVGGGVIGFL